jgi:hypothetical protein
MTTKPKYKRILLKLSGEALAGDHEQTIDQGVLEYFAKEIHSIHELGVQVAIVVGGGISGAVVQSHFARHGSSPIALHGDVGDDYQCLGIARRTRTPRGAYPSDDRHQNG